ncbi:hypothetical protein KRX19_10250 [Cardiobacteriaceae bacterium TAE3-ERU3]|nr:hypothetical protein [Cardiobacteriaceae bacterium TAE3-ERU3]
MKKQLLLSLAIAAFGGTSIAANAETQPVEEIHPLVYAYFEDIHSSEVEYCGGEEYLQHRDPEGYCYDQVDEAYIKPRLNYQDDDIALVTTLGIKGYEGSGGGMGNVISLRGLTPRTIYHNQGYDFKLERNGDQVIFYYENKNGWQKEIIELGG